MSAELIARLEAAEGWAPELDAAIAGYYAATHYSWWRDRPGELDFTRSLDAALTLLRPGWSYTIEPDAAWVKWIDDGDVHEAHHLFFGRGGNSTALALCIAVLKAWAAQAETIGETA